MVDLFIIAGQSNAEGNSKIELCAPEKRDRKVYENIEYYAKRTLVSGKIIKAQGDFRPVREGLGAGDEENHIGPEMGMAKVLSPLYDGKENRCVLVKHAAGGTSIVMHETNREGIIDDMGYTFEARERAAVRGTWYPESLETERFIASGENRPTGFLLRGLKKTVASAVADLEAQGVSKEDIHFRGIAWMQGETDRKNFGDYARVFPEVAKEIRAFISELTEGRTPCIPIVMGEISETFVSALPDVVAGNKLFIEMQRALPKTVPNLTVLPTSYMHITEADGEKVRLVAFDPWHYAYEDEYELGQLFAKAILEY